LTRSIKSWINEWDFLYSLLGNMWFGLIHFQALTVIGPSGHSPAKSRCWKTMPFNFSPWTQTMCCPSFRQFAKSASNIRCIWFIAKWNSIQIWFRDLTRKRGFQISHGISHFDWILNVLG
jgi:hypothetical protein